MDNYRPTNYIKWFRVEGNYRGNNKPLAQITAFAECGPEWYCLKHLWQSDFNGEEDEWRDVEAVL